MYLSDIKIEGYRLFKDRQILHLRKGLNVLVGENGCGKSVIIDELYQIVTGQLPVSNCTEYEIDGEIYIVRLIRQSDTSYSCDYSDRDGNETHAHMPAFSAIFSDVDINFHSEGISTVKH